MTMDPGALDSSEPGSAPPPPQPTKPMSTEDLLKILQWSTQHAGALATQPHRQLVDAFNSLGEKVGQKWEDNGIGAQFNDVLSLGTLALGQLQHGQVSASTAASVGVERDKLAQSAQQFNQSYLRQTGRDATLDEQWGKTFEQNQKVLAENTRKTNLTSTLDFLQNEIAVGTLDANEATTRVTAAGKAADLQRNILKDWGGRALPADTQYFPNAEPGGPLATAAGALGASFPGFRTQGTFGINPAALASTIPAAQGPSAVPNAQSALARAAVALAGMGVR